MELPRRHGSRTRGSTISRSRTTGWSLGDALPRHLRKEKRRLKSIVAYQTCDLRALKDVLAKTRVRPAVKRKIVAEVMAEHHLSQRRACWLAGITRRTLPSGAFLR